MDPVATSRATNRRWTITALVVLGLLAVVPVTAAVRSDRASATAAEPGDGTTAATAGSSCWGIKQQHPTSTDGIYWLWTAQLDRPGQYHCDMTTDGGGWVLVGRGRNGWTFHPNGQGSPTTVRTTVDGPAAFAPAALDTATINGLLGGADLSAEVDGIRLERSLNSSGTSRQDYRLFPRLTSWKWSFDAGQLLNRVRIDGTTYNGSNARDTNASVAGQSTNQLSGQNNTRRMFTFAWASHNYQQGFGLGTSVGGGSNSSTNHLWTSGGEGSPLPFTRVWLRPGSPTRPTGFTPIPAAGFSAQAEPSLLKARNEVMPWGVVGYNHTNEAQVEPWNTTVLDVRVFGDRVYVGGRFTGVQQGPGATPIGQQFLAAFDLDGNWISTFRPTLDGRVWDMVMTPDGKLIIGGDFTNVNGLPDTSAMAALDPITGEVITTWRASVTRTGSSERAIVRALETRGDWIYAAGRFNRVTGGTATNVTVPSTVSVRTTTGQPGAWRPQINASALDLKVSDDGTRIFMAGYFNAVNGNTTHGYHAITNISDGTPVAGIGAFQPSVGTGTKAYQQAVGETNGNLVVGGSQHSLQLYDPTRTTRIDSHITKSGGDFQAIETIDGWIYAGCHCWNYNYAGTNSWTSPSGFRAVDNIRSVARWNAQTFEYDASWWPNGLSGNNDEGLWGVAMDSRQCLWIGGDYTRGAYSGNAAVDYLGGFARFCPEDSAPPSAPARLQAKVSGAAVNLSWDASSDSSGSVAYDIYRNDRIIATQYGTTFTDTPENGATGRLRYTVRAADIRGNRSASPAPVAVNGPSLQIETPIAYGATWKYLDDGSDQGTAWRTDAFADAGWASGPAVLGWGGTQQTTIGATKPTTTYFRRTFDVADADQVKLLELQAKFTQGAVLYVNGIEAGRWNMPAGTITSTTPASGYVGGAEDAAAKPFKVPGSLLVDGTNTVAVEVHGWRAQSGKVFFDLEATTRGGNGDDAAHRPDPHRHRGPDRGRPGVDPLHRRRPAGGLRGVARRAPIAVVGASTTTFLDPGPAGTPPRSYVVTAFDPGGNTTDSVPATSAPPVTTTTTTVPPTTSTRPPRRRPPRRRPPPSRAPPRCCCPSRAPGAGGTRPRRPPAPGTPRATTTRRGARVPVSSGSATRPRAPSSPPPRPSAAHLLLPDHGEHREPHPVHQGGARPDPQRRRRGLRQRRRGGQGEPPARPAHPHHLRLHRHPGGAATGPGPGAGALLGVPRRHEHHRGGAPPQLQVAAHRRLRPPAHRPPLIARPGPDPLDVRGVRARRRPTALTTHTSGGRPGRRSAGRRPGPTPVRGRGAGAARQDGDRPCPPGAGSSPRPRWPAGGRRRTPRRIRRGSARSRTRSRSEPMATRSRPGPGPSRRRRSRAPAARARDSPTARAGAASGARPDFLLRSASARARARSRRRTSPGDRAPAGWRRASTRPPRTVTRRRWNASSTTLWSRTGPRIEAQSIRVRPTSVHGTPWRTVSTGTRRARWTTASALDADRPVATVMCGTGGGRHSRASAAAVR